MMVRLLITPRIVDRHAQLPRTFRRFEGNVLLGRLVIAVRSEPRVQNHMGIGGFELGEFLKTPLLGAALPIAIEPKEVGMKALVDFAQLTAVESQEPLPRFRILGALRI